MNKYFNIENKKIGKDYPTYFVADIAANHDGDFNRAIDLIYLAAESGADAVKFQHFTADTIVSDRGFKSMGGQSSHQSKWKKSVFEVYQDASLNKDWTSALVRASKKAGVSFFTSPYSLELVDFVDPFVPAYKIGSGDITWHQIISHIASKNKPVMLAAGASEISEVISAMNLLQNYTSDIVLMQCNTNYTASLENFKYIQLNVLKSFELIFPEVILGLSDHTPGHATVLGAVALGARVIEKHFTDDNNKEGPDHKFAMNPKAWRDMVDRTRELEFSLGTSLKKVEDNEKDTVILQRRAIRLKSDLSDGEILTADKLEVLRPCPKDAIQPYDLNKVVGTKLNKSLLKGDYLRWKDLKD